MLNLCFMHKHITIIVNCRNSFSQVQELDTESNEICHKGKLKHNFFELIDEVLIVIKTHIFID